MTRRPGAVAVIVPNYNKEKALRACLESVYAQSHPPDEVVVVDDASTDGSPAIAREFPCTLVELPVNRGAAAARNAGVAACRAPLLFFVDSDNALAPDAIRNAVRALRDTPGCGMVQGTYDREPLFDDGPVERYRVASEHFWRRQATATLFSASLVRRAAYEAADGLDERLRDGEDVEFGNRLPSRFGLLVTDTVVSRADEVDRLWPLLVVVFSRAMNGPAAMLRTWRRWRSGDPRRTWRKVMSPGRGSYLDQLARVSACLSALSLLTLPFVFAFPWLLAVLAGLLAAILAASHEFLRLAYRMRGPGFALFAAGMHLLTQLAFALGFGAGALRDGWIAVFRRPSRTGAATVPRSPARGRP